MTGREIVQERFSQRGIVRERDCPGERDCPKRKLSEIFSVLSRYSINFNILLISMIILLLILDLFRSFSEIFRGPVGNGHGQLGIEQIDSTSLSHIVVGAFRRHSLPVHVENIKMGLFGGYVWLFWGCGGSPKGQKCGI